MDKKDIDAFFFTVKDADYDVRTVTEFRFLYPADAPLARIGGEPKLFISIEKANQRIQEAYYAGFNLRRY